MTTPLDVPTKAQHFMLFLLADGSSVTEQTSSYPKRPTIGQLCRGVSLLVSCPCWLLCHPEGTGVCGGHHASVRNASLNFTAWIFAPRKSASVRSASMKFVIARVASSRLI